MGLPAVVGNAFKRIFRGSVTTVKETVVLVESDEEKRERTYRDTRITRDPRRDLTGISHDRHLLVCNHLNRENPIAKRGIQNTTSFVASEGFSIRATSEVPEHNAAVQKELDTHWQLCQWNKRINKRTATLCVEGEWLYWCPSRSNGHFQMKKILPENVDCITRSELDAEKLDTVVLKKPLRFREADGTWRTQDILPIVNQDLWTGQYHGEVLYLGINQLSGQTRGWSDILVVADWLDRVDRTFWVEAERVEYQRAFAWFVKLLTSKEESPATAQARLLARKKELELEGPPKTGSINVHLDGEEWDVKSPKLELEDSVKFLEAMMSLCFGGLNMPVHFFASGGDVNKATAGEMGHPIWAFIRARKAEVIEFMTTAAALCLQRVKASGGLAGVPVEEMTFEVISRDPDRTAYDLIGQMLLTLGQALDEAVTRKAITSEAAGMAWRKAASKLGLSDFIQPEGRVVDGEVVKSEPGLAAAGKDISAALEAARPKLELVKPLALNGGKP